jgi:hypothetical protein
MTSHFVERYRTCLNSASSGTNERHFLAAYRVMRVALPFRSHVGFNLFYRIELLHTLHIFPIVLD